MCAGLVVKALTTLGVQAEHERVFDLASFD